MRILRAGLGWTLCAGVGLVASAGTVTWTGAAGDGKWKTAGNWDTASRPGATDNTTLGGVAEYVAPGDLYVTSPGTLTIGPGGLFYQTSGAAWMQVSGTILVEGGEFDTGTCGQINLSGELRVISGTFRSRSVALNTTGSGKVVLLGGMMYRNGNYTYPGGIVFAGGGFDITGELQYVNLAVHSNGVLRTPMIAPQGTSRVLTLTGGQIVVTAATTPYWGFYQPSGCSVNFTEASSGKLTFTNCVPADVFGRYFSNSKIRLAGATLASEAEMLQYFDVVASTVPGMGNSVDISLKQAEAGVASFVDDACAADQLASTSVRLTATMEDSGSPAADVFSCYGTVNGLLTFGNWQNRVPMGSAQAGAAFTNTPTLAADTVYFHRFAATNGSGVVFAAPTPTFVMTAPVGVTAPASLPENSSTPATITIARPSANNCSSVALSVPFTLGGTATEGTHYTLSTTSPATIPVGASSVALTLTPIADWSTSDERSVSITLQPSANYLAPTQGVASVTLLNAVLPAAPTNAWLGAISEDSTVAGNWSLGVVPAAGHHIVFSPEYARRSLFWTEGTAAVVAGWSQPLAFADETRRVVFHTTSASPLTIAGDCDLQGGTWTHDGPSATPTKALAVTVQGNLTVGAGATLSAGSGVANLLTGYARGYASAGPGYVPSAGDQGTGSSYGGEGSTNDVTYGSILNPLGYGSSGRGDNAQFAGAGLIVVTVGGTLTVNGAVLARGFGYTGTGRGASTGGSINLTAGSLQGNGTIGADGGRDVNYGSGSGGRIRVKLTGPGATFDGFSGTLTAHGNAGYPGSAAGTIALQSATDSASSGLVVVDNAQFSDATNAPYRAMGTHLPPRQQTEASFAETSWLLRNHASVRLTRNVTVRALGVEGTSARLFTEGFTLTTHEFVVDGVAQGSGSYSAADFPALLFGNGAVVVPAQGTLVLVR